MHSGNDAWARERKQAEALGWGFTLLETIDPRAAGLIPLHFQQENGLLAFGTSERDGLDLLLVAVDGPEREDVIDELRFQMQRAVKLFLCPPNVLREGWALVASGKGRGGAAPTPDPSMALSAPAEAPGAPDALPIGEVVSGQADDEEALEELELILEPEMIVEEAAPLPEPIPEPLPPAVSDGWSDELDAMPVPVSSTSSIPLPGNIPSRPPPPVAVAAAAEQVNPAAVAPAPATVSPTTPGDMVAPARDASGGAPPRTQVHQGVALGRVALSPGGT